jgi:hypothetical protein
MPADDAKRAIKPVLLDLKSFLAHEHVSRLSEADTKAHFIDPLLIALGWSGISTVRREYYVKSSQEFIDYVMLENGRPILAIEAKSIQTPLTEKHASQLLSYTAIEGIEWAVLTNGREIQLFNTFLKGDLSYKRILKLNLLAFDSEAEIDPVFDDIWQMSRESITSPEGTRRWVNRQRLEKVIREILLNPASAPVSALVEALANQEISATSADVAAWFQNNLTNQKQPQNEIEIIRTTLPGAGVSGYDTGTDSGERPAKPASKHRQPVLAPGGDNRSTSGTSRQQHSISMRDLLDLELLQPGAVLILIGPGKCHVAEATVDKDGRIAWDGQLFNSPSDRVFAQLMGHRSLNGWLHWHLKNNGTYV